MIRRARRYPPGPGNTSHFVRLTWRHALHLWWNPLEYVTKLGQEYGDLTTFMLFGKRAYLVNSPRLVHEVLVSKRKRFIKQPRQMRVIRQTFGDGLLVSSGDKWLKQRRMLQKAFHVSYMDRFAAITAERTKATLDELRDRAGTEVDMADCMGRLTMAATLQSMFSVVDPDQSRELSEAIRLLSKTFIREIQALFVLPDWMPLQSKREKRESHARLDAFLTTAIAQRRKRPERHDDLLAMLLRAVDDEGDGRGMTDQQARDEAVTMLVAGNHTTSAALSWLWWLMSEHADIQSRLAHEAREVLGGRTATLADCPRLPYTERVIKETMRLYPPAWALFAREVVDKVSLDGYALKPGDWIFIYPYVTHRDERFFPDPLTFDPDRFTPQREAKIPQHAYFPFGLGPHVCIGNRLSMLQMTQIVSTIAQHFRFNPLPDRPPLQVEPHVAIRPLGGVSVMVSRTDIPVRDGV